MGESSWGEYEKLILAKLDEHTKALKDQSKTIDDLGKDFTTAINELKVDVEVAKVKWSIVGGLSGLVTAIAVLAVKSMVGK